MSRLTAKMLLLETGLVAQWEPVCCVCSIDARRQEGRGHPGTAGPQNPQRPNSRVLRAQLSASAGKKVVGALASLDLKLEELGVLPELTPQPVPEDIAGEDGQMHNERVEVRCRPRRCWCITCMLRTVGHPMGSRVQMGIQKLSVILKADLPLCICQLCYLCSRLWLRSRSDFSVPSASSASCSGSLLPILIRSPRADPHQAARPAAGRRAGVEARGGARGISGVGEGALVHPGLLHPALLGARSASTAGTRRSFCHSIT